MKDSSISKNFTVEENHDAPPQVHKEESPKIQESVYQHKVEVQIDEHEEFVEQETEIKPSQTKVDDNQIY